MHQNGEVLRKLYEAFDKADLATIQNSMADDGVLHVAGDGPLSGDYKGKDEILAYLGDVVSRSEGTFKVEVHDILANDQHVVVLSRVTAEKGGQRIDENGVEIFHVTSGKISEAWFTGMNPNAIGQLLA